MHALHGLGLVLRKYIANVGSLLYFLNPDPLTGLFPVKGGILNPHSLLAKPYKTLLTHPKVFT
jgi:hypothetical protein